MKLLELVLWLSSLYCLTASVLYGEQAVLSGLWLFVACLAGIASTLVGCFCGISSENSPSSK